MINNTASQITPDTTNPIVDFIDNTSAHTKLYLCAVGAIVSFRLCDYSGAAKMYALVGRCSSLFMAGELLYTQLDQPSTKIAVTAIKATSICLGIANIALSSPALLIYSLICDVIAQCGALGLATCDPSISLDRILESLLMFMVNLFLLAAINFCSTELLIASTVLVFIGSVFCVLATLPSLAATDPDTDAHYRARLNMIIGGFLHLFVANALKDVYVTGKLEFAPAISPLNDSMASAAASFFPFINFRSDIFIEWNLATR